MFLMYIRLSVTFVKGFIFSLCLVHQDYNYRWNRLKSGIHQLKMNFVKLIIVVLLNKTLKKGETVLI